MKIIDKLDLVHLQNLRKEAMAYQTSLDELVEEAQEITGETEEAGFTFDYILNGVDLKYTLKAIGVRVKK